jgi:hypothetical protein
MRALPAVLAFLVFASSSLVLAASAGTEPLESEAPAADGASLMIDAGRLGVMVDQSEESLKALTPTVKEQDLGPASAQRAYAFHELVAAVLRYNLVAGDACGAGVVPAKLCPGPYLPGWLKDGPRVDHSEADLRAMIDDATAHLEPFWSDICSKGKRAAGREVFCKLE